MTARAPDHRPRMDEDEVRATVTDAIALDPGILDYGIELFKACPVRLLGVRGYFRDSIGRKGANDLNEWDDAIAVVSPEGVVPFNANVDPVAAGWNPGVDKLYAQLEPGVWPMRQGPHRGRPGHLRQMTDEESELAWLSRYFTDDRQWGEFAVRRITADGKGRVEWGCQNINVHAGAPRSTGSWGCQTIYPDQWPEFTALVYRVMNFNGQAWDPKPGQGRPPRYGFIPYVLTDKRLH